MTTPGPFKPAGSPTGLLFIIVLVPVGLVSLLTITITLMTVVSCWYRKRYIW